jgi:hypothetical protein
VTVQPSNDSPVPKPGASLQRSKEEHLRWARPLPPPEEMVIEDLTDEEWDAFWECINDL